MTGILILNYNNEVDLKKCVTSIFHYINLDIVKILVVDNGSIESVRTRVSEFLQNISQSFKEINIDDPVGELLKVNYLVLPCNVGYANGNNAGLSCLYGDKDISEILILNSDIVICDDIIPILRTKLYELPNAGIVSPVLYKPNGKLDTCCARKNYSKVDLLLTFSYLLKNVRQRRATMNKILLQDPDALNKDFIEVELTSGSCMLFKKDVLFNIGGFDKNTFLYYEESILFKKLQKQGKKTFLIPSANCIHTGGATTNSTQNAYFLKKCNLDSLLYYCREYEELNYWELTYIKCTGYIVLFRLYLGKIYKKCFMRGVINR